MDKYPENRLNIRVDEQGNISYEQDPSFAAAYFDPQRKNPLALKLEALQEQLDEWIAAEPLDLYGDAHDDWELRRSELEDEIEELEQEIGD